MLDVLDRLETQMHDCVIGIGRATSLQMRILVFPVLGFACLLCPAVGQTETEVKEPLPVSSLALPSIEELETKVVSLQEDPNLDPNLRDKLVELNRGSLEHLKQAQSWKEKTAAYQSNLDQTPKRSEEIRAEIAQPLEAATPEIPDSSTTAELEQKLAQSEATLSSARGIVKSFEEKAANLAERRLLLPELLATARNNLQGMKSDPQTQFSPDEDSRLIEAERILFAAKESALQREIEAYEKEIPLCDLLAPFFTLSRDLAVREVSKADTLFSAYQKAHSARTKSEAREAASKARMEAKTAVREATADPVFRDLVNRIASENARLAELRTEEEGPVRGNEKAVLEMQRIESRLNQVSNDYGNVRKRVDAVDLDDSLGPLLRKHRSELPNSREYILSLDKRQDLMAKVQIEQIDLREDRYALANLDAVVEKDLAAVPSPSSEEARTRQFGVIRELRETQRGYLDDLLKDYQAYITRLHDLDSRERELVAETERFAAFIRKNVLWVPSGTVLSPTVLVDGVKGAFWFAGIGKWLGVLKALFQDALSRPLLDGLALFAVVLLLWLRKSFRVRIKEIGLISEKPSCSSFTPTVEALFRTLLLAIPVPIILWYVGRRLSLIDLLGMPNSEFVRSIGFATQITSGLVLAFEILRHLIRKNGLAVSHFGWPEGPLVQVRKNLRWLGWIALPTIFTCSSLQWFVVENHQESFGRLMYMVNVAAFIVFGQRVLRPEGGSFQEIMDFKRGTSRNRFRFLWYVLGVGIPATIFILALLGYYFTALELGIQLFYTLSLTLATVILYGLFLRWLLVTRRRLSREQAQKRRELAKAKDTDVPGVDIEVEEEQVDLARIDLQTRRLIRSCVGVAFLIGLWFIWTEELPALAILNRVEIPGTRVTETIQEPDGTERLVTIGEPITLAHVALALLIGLLTIAATKNLPGLLEIAILQRLSLLPGERYALTTIVRYAILTVGVVLAFNAVGIGWSKVQWLVAAVGLGLGFGLQEIFANFISGLILLFERPIRVGDTVTVGGINGTVTKINIRATTITDFDRKELVVPNKEFVTGQLINWSLTDSVLRLVVPVGIAYGSDTKLAEEILYQVAVDENLVLEEPPPKVVFYNFGASSLDFELRVFTKDVEALIQARHTLHMAIDDAFRKAGIEIAFPQRDIHLRSVDGSLPTALDPLRETNL